MRKNILKAIAYSFYLLVATLFILEIAYRNYWIDFYGPELRALNDVELSKKEAVKGSLLAIGDSFTAHPESYVSVLRDSLTDVKVINAGVPGTSALQNLLPLSKRIRKFQPNVLIYQMYVGNDLLEFNHPSGSKNIGVVRKVYWWLSDRIRVLGLLNYRSLSLRHKLFDDLETFSPENREVSFDGKLFTPRTRMHIFAEPGQLEDVVLMQNRRAADVERYVQALKRHLKMVPASISIILLVVPHAAQLNSTYQVRMRTLGMRLADPIRITQEDYPLVRYLEQELNQPNLSVLNPIQALKEADVDKAVFYQNDPHLNRYGQEILGRLVLKHIHIHIGYN